MVGVARGWIVLLEEVFGDGDDGIGVGVYDATGAKARVVVGGVAGEGGGLGVERGGGGGRGCGEGRWGVTVDRVARVVGAGARIVL